MIDQIDSILEREGIKFDSSIIVSQGKVLYFNEGLFSCEVDIRSDAYGQPYVSLFSSERKLWK